MSCGRILGVFLGLDRCEDSIAGVFWVYWMILRILGDFRNCCSFSKYILGGLLKHPELQAFCENYNGQTLSTIHQSFANQDKISAMITKWRISFYPDGTGIPAVLHEFEVKHKGKPDRVRIYSESIRNTFIIDLANFLYYSIFNL